MSEVCAMSQLDAPDEIHGVRRGFFSISRYYGGCIFQGYQYIYDPMRDVLIRADVVKQRASEAQQAKTEAKKKAKADAKSRQGNLL